MSAEYKTLAAVLKELRAGMVNSSKGDVMPPNFFEMGQRVNAKKYIEVLDTVMMPWKEAVAGESPITTSRTESLPTQPTSHRTG